MILNELQRPRKLKAKLVSFKVQHISLKRVDHMLHTYVFNYKYKATCYLHEYFHDVGGSGILLHLRGVYVTQVSLSILGHSID